MIEEKCVEVSKEVAGLVVYVEGSSLVKIGIRNNPNLATTKPSPMRATQVLSQARKVLWLARCCWE
jgi:hypothetical protein